MSDARLRELERAWKASGSLEDEVAFLREVVRTQSRGTGRTNWSGPGTSVEVHADRVSWAEGAYHWRDGGGGGGSWGLREFLVSKEARERVSDLVHSETPFEDVARSVRAVLAGELLAEERLELLEARLAEPPGGPEDA